MLRADHAAIEIAIPSSRDNDADSEISAVQFLPRDATQSAVMPQYVVYARQICPSDVCPWRSDMIFI